MLLTPQKRHHELYGDDTALLPLPAQKVSLPTGDYSREWHSRQPNDGFHATAMKQQKNDYGVLPF